MRHLADITVGNLGANEIGGDETDEREHEIDERGIVVTPHVRIEQFWAAEDEPKAECGWGEKEGQ